MRLIHWILFYKVYHKDGKRSSKTSIKIIWNQVSDEARKIFDNTWNYFQEKKKKAKKEGRGS